MFLWREKSYRDARESSDTTICTPEVIWKYCIVLAFKRRVLIQETKELEHNHKELCDKDWVLIHHHCRPENSCKRVKHA